MSARSRFEDRITKLFLEKMNLDIPSSDTDLFETAALDSMAFVELLMLLEEEFGIAVSLDDMELDNFRSIERIAELVCPRELSQSGTERQAWSAVKA